MRTYAQRIMQAVLLLLALALGIKAIQGQQLTPTLTIRTKWQIPTSACPLQIKCSILFRLAENDHLYAINFTTGHLLRFRPNNLNYADYDLSHYNIWSLSFDFIPFGTDFVIIFGGTTPNLYKYSLASRTLSALELPSNTELRHCYGNSPFHQRSIMRFG
jgi:hypothetical protein